MSKALILATFLLAGFQRGWTGVRPGDQDVGQRPLGGDVLRWPEEALSHQRKAEEEGLDQPVRHHPGEFR